MYLFGTKVQFSDWASMGYVTMPSGDQLHIVCLGSTNLLCLGQRLKHVNPLEMT